MKRFSLPCFEFFSGKTLPAAPWAIGIFFFAWSLWPQPCLSQAGKSFVGPDACKSCHEKEYQIFMNSSRMAKSFSNTEKIKRLTDEERQGCYECHTTGYRQPGGFRSARETPHMANLSCETCHGPGSAHIESGDPKQILSSIPQEGCLKCHDEKRLGPYIRKPLPHGGVH